MEFRQKHFLNSVILDNFTITVSPSGAMVARETPNLEVSGSSPE